MTLQDWRPKGSIEKEVRQLLQSKRHVDTSTKACKLWVRCFIQEIVPGWEPGKELTTKQAQLVGRKFGRLLCRPDPKAPRQRRRQ
jgi:hypothetical protein